MPSRWGRGRRPGPRAGTDVGASTGGRGKVVAAINVTPLVDVVLVLLIIFMVTATYIARQAFEAELPTAAKADPLEANPPLVIEVRADRSIWVGGESFSIEALPERVRRKDGPDGKIAEQAVIAADKAVDYGRVTEVIDLIRRNGIEKFALEIRLAPKAAAPEEATP